LVEHHDDGEEHNQEESYTAGAVGVLLHLLPQKEKSSPLDEARQTEVFEALQRCMDVCVEKVHDYQHDKRGTVRYPYKTKNAQNHPTVGDDEQVAEAFEAILYVIEKHARQKKAVDTREEGLSSAARTALVRVVQSVDTRFKNLITNDDNSCKVVEIVKTVMDFEDLESSKFNWHRLLDSMRWLAREFIMADPKVNHSSGGITGLKFACSSLEQILKNSQASCRHLSDHIVTGGLMALVPKIAQHVHKLKETAADSAAATNGRESAPSADALNNFGNVAWELVENTMVMKLAAESEIQRELQPALNAIFDSLEHIDKEENLDKKKEALLQVINAGCAGVILHVLLAHHLRAPTSDLEHPRTCNIEALERCLPACIEIVYKQLRSKDGKHDAIELAAVASKDAHPTNISQRKNEAMSVILLCLSDDHFLYGGDGKKRIRALMKDEARVVSILLTNIIRLKYKKTQLTSWDSIHEKPTRVIDQLESLESHTHLSRLFQCLQRVTQESSAAFEGEVTPDGIQNICDAMLLLSYDPSRGDDFGEQEKKHAQQREELKDVFGDQKNSDESKTSRTSEDEDASWPDVRMYNWSTALRRRRTIAYLLFPEKGILAPHQIRPVPEPEKIFDRIRKEVIKL
jgi:hypothetical protein